MKVSIIIPFQQENEYLVETLKHIDALNYESVEIILLPDKEIPEAYQETELRSRHSVICIPTGTVSPAIKRDIGAEQCTGEYLAFIDDDAYPDSNWLAEAVPHLRDDKTCAVGGPQVTPPEDSFWQKVSGAMFLSILNGKAADRYWPASQSYFVDDWPSVNLIVKKDDFLQLGGFDSSYWPGEDTKLCYDITQTLGKNILYIPTAIVYHHRRSGIVKHLKQVGNYGKHRGFFAKRFPETSLRFSYFIPSLFFLFVLLGWLLPVVPGGRWFFAGLWSLYLTALLFSVISIFFKQKNIFIAIATVPYTVGTHFWYGFSFIKGFLLTKDLKSRLGR